MPRLWSSCTDGELLRDASRDPEAFAELYRRHEALVLAFLARRTQDPDAAAELTSETFATALLRADRFRDNGEPAIGWLLGIARHQFLSSWRSGQVADRARRRLAVEPLQLTDASFERIEALIDADAASPELQLALEALPPDQRRAVEGFVLHEQPYAAMASDLGVAEATIRQRVSRGLAHLRMNLESIR